MNLFDWQRHLVRPIIQIRHLAHRAQLLQNLAELWCTVWIGCPAKSHNAPIKFRMGEYVPAAPERLVVRVGDYNCGPQARTGYHLIELDWGHCSPGILLETPRCEPIQHQNCKISSDVGSRK